MLLIITFLLHRNVLLEAKKLYLPYNKVLGIGFLITSSVMCSLVLLLALILCSRVGTGEDSTTVVKPGGGLIGKGGIILYSKSRVIGALMVHRLIGSAA